MEHNRPVGKPCGDLCRSDLPGAVGEWSVGLLLGHTHQSPYVRRGDRPLMPMLTDTGHAYRPPVAVPPDEILIRHLHGLHLP